MMPALPSTSQPIRSHRVLGAYIPELEAYVRARPLEECLLSVDIGDSQATLVGWANGICMGGWQISDPNSFRRAIYGAYLHATGHRSVSVRIEPA